VDAEQNNRRSISDELAKLADLRDRGVLSDEEFQAQKQVLLAPQSPTASSAYDHASETLVADGQRAPRLSRGARTSIAVLAGLIVAAVIVLVLVLSARSTQTIRGVDDIFDQTAYVGMSVGSGCHGSPDDGYGVFYQGAGVQIKNGAGTVIGSTFLSRGHIADSTTSAFITSGSACEFTWVASGVPDTAQYQVEVGGDSSTELTYSKAELAKDQWYAAEVFGSQPASG